MTLISPASAVAAECGEEERAIACPGEREREEGSNGECLLTERGKRKVSDTKEIGFLYPLHKRRM